MKFADDTTIIGRISDNDETMLGIKQQSGRVVHREHLLLNVSKTKELITDFRKKEKTHTLVYISGAEVEQVNSFPGNQHHKEPVSVTSRLHTS